MDDGFRVPIIRKPSKPNTILPLPEEPDFNSRRERTSTKIKTAKRVRFKPATTQTWVHVATKRSGTIFVGPYTPFTAWKILAGKVPEV